MRKVIIFFAVVGLAVSGVAKAQQASCEDIASLAKTVMEQRQNLTPKRTLLARVDSSNINAKESVKLMVEKAYETRPQSRAIDQQREVLRFSNEMYQSCLSVQSIIR